MKIQYFSDVHDNNKFWDTFEPVGDVIVAAGDMGNSYAQAVKNSELNWLWVDGDCEYNKTTFTLPYVRHINGVNSTKGQRFIGCTLWTDSGNSPLHCIDFDIICKWNQKQVAWLWYLVEKKHTKDAVIITHHAPSFKSSCSINPLAPAFCNNLDQLVKESGAKLWIHGHTHNACDYMIRNTRVVSNPVGNEYEKTGYERNKVIEV